VNFKKGVFRGVVLGDRRIPYELLLLVERILAVVAVTF